MTLEWPHTSTQKNLRRDLKGNTAMMFALMAVPVFAVIGFAIDFRQISNAKSMSQEAMDAAVLTAAQVYGENFSEKLKKRKKLASDAGRKTFHENLTNTEDNLRWDTPQFNFDADHHVTGTVKINVTTSFGKILGKEKLEANILSQAVAGDGRPYEIVLVLDNTTSMFDGTRMEDMREAAKTFTEIMYRSSPDPSLTRISVIPTAALVNINMERPAVWNASVDKGVKKTPAQPAAGSRMVPPAPFEDRTKYLLHPDTGSSMTKADMKALFEPVEWRGCIRTADNERKVTSGGFVQGKLNDTPAPSMRWPAARLAPELQRKYVNETPPSPPPPPPPPPPPGSPPPPPPPPSSPPPPPPPPPPPVPGVQSSLDAWQSVNGPELRQVSGSYFQGWVSNCDQNDVQDGNSGARNVYMPTTQDCSTSYSSKKTGTIKACVSDPNEFAYFNSGNQACEWQKNVLPWDSQKPISGPQINCPTAMLGLSESPAQIYAKLDHMYPVPGGTQIDIGMMWGLRALSPRKQWVDFFGYQKGKEPLPFNTSEPRKIMIVLTDGANRAPYHFEGYYGCFDDNDRGEAGPCWKSDDTPSLSTKGLDALTLDSCKAIRDDYGVEVYTVAVDVKDSSAVKVLRDCAGSDDRAFDVTGAELATTFETLAMRSLRLTR